MKITDRKTVHITTHVITYPDKQKHLDFLSTIINKKDRLMVAVSGGSDSIFTACLLYDFFVQKKIPLKQLFFIHCNHATRKENTQEEAFIKQFFEGTNCIIRKRTSTTKATEETLRKRRYKIFNTETTQHKITYLVFGHNLTDRIESTFLNLLRGAHLNGFIAMQAQGNHHLLQKSKILRPILGLTKDEVLSICKKNKIPFVTDPSNKDNTTSLRNKLRNKVLPELYKLANKQNTTTNSFIESMKNIYTSLETSHNILNSDSGTKCCSRNGTINSIKKSPHRKATFAYQRTIDPKNITNEDILQITKQLNISNNITTPRVNELTKFLRDNQSGYKYFNTTYFFKSHGKIYIISAPKEFWKKTVDSKKKMDTVTMKRFPQKDDRYKGKTRNEWCINQKIPIFWRNFIPIIVTKNNQVIKIFRPQL